MQKSLFQPIQPPTFPAATVQIPERSSGAAPEKTWGVSTHQERQPLSCPGPDLGEEVSWAPGPKAFAAQQESAQSHPGDPEPQGGWDATDWGGGCHGEKISLPLLSIIPAVPSDQFFFLPSLTPGWLQDLNWGRSSSNCSKGLPGWEKQISAPPPWVQCQQILGICPLVT